MQSLDGWIDQDVIVERSGSNARGRLLALLSRGLVLMDSNGMSYIPRTSVQDSSSENAWQATTITRTTERKVECMPYTVAVSFDKFRQSIELASNHRETAAKRRDNLVSLLKKDVLILEAFPSGSIPKYTAVTGYADLDVIVAMYDYHVKGKKPSQVLKAVRDSLGQHRSNVRRNGQAVTLRYETWPNVDVVPARRYEDVFGNVSHYEIPDMNQERWLESKPKAHSQAMSEMNAQCGPNFKRIVKMVKWWNRQHSSLLQSYHIEVMALKIYSGSTLSDYSWDVFRFFDRAYNLTESYLAHEGTLVDYYLDYKKRPEVRNRLATAKSTARSAWHATYGSNDDHREAIRLWRKIFGDKFPAYG